MAGLNPLVFLDVAVGRRAVGRLKFELFHDQLPFTSENFRCLCTGETGLGYWLRPRWYKDTNFLRVVPGFMCQGGDFNFGSMLMGESIYGQRFRDERFCYKRIEIDFRGEGDLRHAPRSSWETVVTQSATQTPGTRRWNPVERILNCKETAEFTSFLLSESLSQEGLLADVYDRDVALCERNQWPISATSIILADPAKTIIKTCGSTVPLSAVPTLLKIGLELEWMCYSRKNFLAPEEQPHEHQSMEGEVEACKKVFGPVGDAYVLGPLTGEHWLFYDALYLKADYLERGDFTIDVMMYDLPKDVQEVFHTSEPEGSRVGAEKMTKESGLAQIAEFMNAEVDDYCFESCGYSCNMHSGLSYAMVHVTPQDLCSYASFETNFGSALRGVPERTLEETLNQLMGQVIAAFRPGRLTVTLLQDQGAVPFLGSAPFAAAENHYHRRNITSAWLGKDIQDYQATIANFDRD
ncbi:S-adenosylmethionine decarboxylase proenzyme (AdoMetDC) (SAMDC) [Cleaved into: S-adenosylmethionine decarboxylase alpha chain [Durusdinium trenchii]|uniref:S-adenosylmethionine decarboxylase proenzyme (AdoMetDC) (SAMDC) [Cleaved into: S-adenosylmethionine decarboxylase alpha chain n=1 Tax=Durusdinium trenchii TaxID=1381693 RepID=A0ABP0QCB9_9DINO